MDDGLNSKAEAYDLGRADGVIAARAEREALEADIRALAEALNDAWAALLVAGPAYTETVAKARLVIDRPGVRKVMGR